MSKALCIGMLVLACLVASLSASAGTLNVPSGYESIGAALAAAQAGDTILVACGIYRERNLEMASDVVLRSENGDPECVTIDAGGFDTSRVIRCSSLDAVARIEGFTLSGGNYSSGGGGIYIGWSPVIVEDCVIRGNSTSGFGGGVYCRYPDSQSQFINCVFEANTAGSGGGVYLWDTTSCEFTNCTFIGNSALNDGGAAYCRSPGFTTTFDFCTFDGNSAGIHGGGVFAASPLVIENCIISDSPLGEGVFLDGGGSVDLSCTDIHGNGFGDWTEQIDSQLGEDGNIGEDPLYCGIPGSGNYYLRSDSPCAPGAEPGCGAGMGAWPVGCENTVVDSATWSAIKSLY